MRQSWPSYGCGLRTLRHDQRVRNLHEPTIPAVYRGRHEERETVPLSVLGGMEQHPSVPWMIRNQMLKEIGWTAKATSRTEWKAEQLNSLFQQHGVTGQSSRITAATVLHGERVVVHARQKHTIVGTSAVTPVPTVQEISGEFSGAGVDLSEVGYDMNPQELPELLRLREVAAALRCSKAHVHKIVSGQVAGTTRLSAISLERLKLVSQHALQHDQRVHHPDELRMPAEYAGRRVEGEAVANMPAAMEQFSAGPWTILDRILKEMERRLKRAAAPVSGQFRGQCVTGLSGHIVAVAPVAHGETVRRLRLGITKTAPQFGAPIELSKGTSRRQ